MNWTYKPYETLTLQELYAVLKLRVDVFVVEQNCAYPELDGKDHLALHLIGTVGREIVAYARIFPPEVLYPGMASIGRVVIKDTHRGQDRGHALMEEGIHRIRQDYDDVTIRISAQSYLRSFYEQQGFKAISEEYLWDGIVHLDMDLTKKD